MYIPCDKTFCKVPWFYLDHDLKFDILFKNINLLFKHYLLGISVISLYAIIII